MPLKNTRTEYGAVTKTFHWTIAVIVLILLPLGIFMGDMPMGLAKLQAVNLHKSLGMTVLLLVIARICWHIYSNRPDEVETIKPWERIGAKIMHYSLYVLLLAQPLTGWIFSSAKGRAVNVFGLFTLPNLVGTDKVTGKTYGHTFNELHSVLGWIILILVCLHIAAALKHHFIDKDRVLTRMLPAVAFMALLLAAVPAAAGVPQWVLVHEKSSITFRPTQLGTEFKGTFGVFSAAIAFDPNDLAGSKASIDVQLGTAHTGAPDRDENLKSKDWFDVAQFPDAKFETKAIQKTGPDAYKAEGILTIKNISLPVVLPFKLVITPEKNGEVATMDGSVTLDRSKFQIGTGQWKDTSIIANEVPVDIHVVAVSASAGKAGK